MADESIQRGELEAWLSSFQREMELLRDATTVGFSGVHSRLDIANGKLVKHGEDISAMKERIKNAESMAVQSVERCKDCGLYNLVPQPPPPQESSAPSSRDMKMLAGVALSLGTVGAVFFEIVKYVIPLILR